MVTPKKIPKIEIILSLSPFLLLLLLEFFYAISLQEFTRYIAHYSLAVLITQLVYQIIFLMGEICPGQRGRLAKFNFYTLIYWVPVLLWGFVTRTSYAPQSIFIGLALLLLFTTWRQPKDKQYRRINLKFGVGAGLVALAVYLMIFYEIGVSEWINFNPIMQIFIGICIAYWGLLVSKSRLQQFMALLPKAMTLLLLFNILYCISVVAISDYMGLATLFDIPSVSIYFAIHLIVLVILWKDVLYNRPLSRPKVGLLFAIGVILSGLISV